MIKQTWPSPVKRRAVVSLDHAKPLSFAHSVPSTLSTLVLYSVLCSLCSSHPVNTGSVQCPLLTLFRAIRTYSIQCPLVILFHLHSAHRFNTVSIGQFVPSTQCTQVLYSVLCSLFDPPSTHRPWTVFHNHAVAVHALYTLDPLHYTVSINHSVAVHTLYTLDPLHCITRCPIITQLQYTQTFSVS